MLAFRSCPVRQPPPPKPTPRSAPGSPARHKLPLLPALRRHHRYRADPRPHRLRPAARRRARSQAAPARQSGGKTRANPPTVAAPAAAADPGLARLPTAAEIAAQVRRRPVGAVFADICRDLGIVPAHPLWRELLLAVVANGGRLTALFKGVVDQSNYWITDLFTIAVPARPPAWPPAAAGSSTGPP